MGCVIVMNYCASVYCMNSFSPMKSVWHNYPIHLQIFHIISAHWLCILQMAYNLRRGRSLEDEEQPPPPLPPPTLAKLMQTVVESQRMLAKTMRQLVNRDDRNVRQGPEPNNIAALRTSWTQSLLSLETQKNIYKLMNG
jgi:hypothetical protein